MVPGCGSAPPFSPATQQVHPAVSVVWTSASSVVCGRISQCTCMLILLDRYTCKLVRIQCSLYNADLNNNLNMNTQSYIEQFASTHFVEKVCLEELNLYALCNIFYIICFKFAYLKTNDSVLDYHWFTLHGVGSLFYNSSLGKLCTRKKTCIHNLNILILNCIFPTKH